MAPFAHMTMMVYHDLLPFTHHRANHAPVHAALAPGTTR